MHAAIQFNVHKPIIVCEKTRLLFCSLHSISCLLGMYATFLRIISLAEYFLCALAACSVMPVNEGGPGGSRFEVIEVLGLSKLKLIITDA